jgi:nucleotide-binding universal stress UspA family protein
MQATLLASQIRQPCVSLDQLSGRNILLATDFSECSTRAFDHALGIASRYQSQLYLFHCIDPAPYYLAESNAAQITREDAQRELEQLVSDFRREGRAKNVEIRVVVEVGNLSVILPKLVEDLDLALIVVGTHGRTGWRKLVLGSVAEMVVDKVSCPVLCVSPSSDGQRVQEFGPQNIVFASEHSARCKLAESYASSLAHKYHSRLTAIDVLENRSGRVLARISQFGWCDPDLRSTNLDPAETKPLELRTEIGAQSDLILRVADHVAADLIVLAITETHKLTHRFVSTNSYQVLINAACPVLTVRDR